MTIGASIFLIAVGAILAFAVQVTADGFDINMVGYILMIAGGIGLLLSLFFWTTASRRRVSGGSAPADRETVVERTEVR